MLAPPTLLLGRMLPVFYTVGGAILYCATPPTLLLGQMLSVFIRLAAHSSTVLPLPTLLLGQMLPVFIRLAAPSSTVLAPPTLLLGQMLPVFYTVVCAIFYCATLPLHYCWGRCCPFLYGWRRDPLLCYPPLH